MANYILRTDIEEYDHDIFNFTSRNSNRCKVFRPLLVDMISGSGKTQMLLMLTEYLRSHARKVEVLGVEKQIFLSLSTTIKLPLEQMIEGMKNVPVTENEVSYVKNITTVFKTCKLRLREKQNRSDESNFHSLGSYSNNVIIDGTKRALNRADWSRASTENARTTIVIIVDEVSTINIGTWRDIMGVTLNNLKLYENIDIKFILMGDSKQLLSPDSYESYVYNKVPNAGVLEGTTTIRCKDPVFNKFIQKLRRNSDVKITTIPNKVGKTLKRVGKNKFRKLLVKEIVKDPSNCKYITFTNNRVDSVDSWIRTSVFKKKDDIESGDIIQFKRAGEAGPAVKLSVGVEYKILEVKKVKVKKYRFVHLVIEGWNRALVLPWDEFTRKETAFSDIMKHLLTVKDVCNDHDIIYSHRHRVVRMHCNTIHSVQGTSIKTVFLDLSDEYLDVMDHATFSRWLYVSIGRTVDKIYITGKFPEKFKILRKVL